MERGAINTPSSSSILKIRNECARKKDNIYQGDEKAISHAREIYNMCIGLDKKILSIKIYTQIKRAPISI
jgi:hypothetical protein